jgi:DNA-binding phage protein
LRPDQIRRAVARLRQGDRVAQVARDLGMRGETLAAALRRQGIEPNSFIGFYYSRD